MPDPITLTLVGSATLTEGIKFLYGQATEALKRRREHKAAEVGPTTVLATGDIPAIFADNVKPLQIHLDKVAELEPQLIAARKALADYADGLEPVTPDNIALLQQTDALRRVMEAVYQCRLTFQGEARPASGLEVYGSVDIDEIRGYAAGVRGDTIFGGKVRGTIKANTVSEGGQAFGVSIDRIG